MVRALTSFNNKTITYDAIGNPLTIGNNITTSWINGRILNSYMDTSKNLNISYKYNREGSGVTTVEALESTFMFKVIHDTPTHYQVHPRGITLKEWREQGVNSKYTIMLESKITKWNGK